eukprot:5207384-Heterocapsa_arctica.AAC.1
MPADASTLRASIAFWQKDLTRGAPKLQRARMALRGFKRLIPAHSRLPVLWPVVFVMIEWMVDQQLMVETQRRSSA